MTEIQARFIQHPQQEVDNSGMSSHFEQENNNAEPSHFNIFDSKGLQRQWLVDFASGGIAGFAVTPIVVVLDTAVTEAAFRRRTIAQSITNTISNFLLRPHRAVLTRPFAAMFLLYGATYMTANVVDSLSIPKFSTVAASEAHTYNMHGADAEANSGWTKFAAVSAVNMLLSLNKDNQFAKAFGRSLATKSLPLASFAPFVLRDGITLFASFNIPPMLAPYLPEVCEESIGRLAVAQLLAPAGSQIIVTPLHLLGLDLYHRNGTLPFRDRVQGMTTGWASSSITRMTRIIPGLALGNVLNTKIRHSWMERLKSDF